MFARLLQDKGLREASTERQVARQVEEAGGRGRWRVSGVVVARWRGERGREV